MTISTSFVALGASSRSDPSASSATVLSSTPLLPLSPESFSLTAENKLLLLLTQSFTTASSLVCEFSKLGVATLLQYGAKSRNETVDSDEVLEDVLGLEDRFVKSLALASTVLSLASALLGLRFCAVLGSRTRYF